MDGIDLVLTIEDRLGITLSDDETIRVGTVGALCALVNSKIHGIEDRCASAAAFYNIRRVFVEQGVVRREDCRPGTELAEVFPPEQLRRIWRRLRRVLVDLPELVFDESGERGAMNGRGVFLGCCVVAFALSLAVFGAAILLAWAFLIPVLLYVNSLLIEQDRRAMPQHLVTVGDLARDCARFQLANNAPLDAEVIRVVRQLTAECSGVSFEDVSMETDFVRDLGA